VTPLSTLAPMHNAPATCEKAYDEVLRHFAELDKCVERSGYRGYEFDDFLASPILRAASLGNLFLQRVFIQIGEKLPINLRPLLGIRKLPSAKANGYFARGYLHAYAAAANEIRLEKARRLLDWLLANPSKGYSGLAWGNAYDFASRGGFFPKDLPTVVWTSQISKAFFLAYPITNESRFADAVVSSAQFVLKDLPRHRERGGTCIAYAPGIPALVHNSNLLGAAALLRAWSLDRDREKYDIAQSALRWSLSHMNEDGSWRYGVGKQYPWIDNLHTGYVIDSLLEAHSLSGETCVPRKAIERSFAFWRKAFFLDDGTPRYYHNRTYPLDIQCAAQAIETFANYCELDATALEDACKVLRWTVSNLRRPDGFFMYQKRRGYRNKAVYIHWGQSTMLAALGILLHHFCAQKDTK